MQIVLDANCFIDSLNAERKEYRSLQNLFAARSTGRVSVFVSRHTLAELAYKPDDAYELARTFPVLPHWLIGAISEQVASIKDLQGSWVDARRNDANQLELKQLAGGGNDIRDRGAYVDALLAQMDVFVTSDQHFVKKVPSDRICERFGLRAVTPSQFVNELGG